MSTIEELERKIRQLEEQLVAQKEKTDLTLEQAERAAEFAKHAYRVDHYGFIWVWDIDAKDYKKTNMRVMNPIIADKALQSRHIADGAVEGRHLQDNVIEGRMLKEKTIGGEKIQDHAVGSQHLRNNCIGSQHIMTHAVRGIHIMPGAITNDKIDPRTIDMHDVVLNSNLITVGRDPDGTRYAVYGNMLDDTTIERDSEGWLFFVKHINPTPQA